MVSRMAQPHPVKIGAWAGLPVVGRVMDEDVPQIPGGHACRRCGCQVESEYAQDRPATTIKPNDTLAQTGVPISS